MPEGRNAAENEVTVTAERAGDDVVVFVRDNGVGMTPAQLEKVFDPFFTTKDVGRGTGLGLSICHTIVERSGGSISAESQPGEGTTFEIRLPIARLATLDAESSAVEASENVRLLLIDDDTRVLEATRRLLSLTYDVETASSVSEAKERVLNASFDAVICDVMMPDTNGIEFHAWLRENQPDLAERFAFYTGGAIGPSIQNGLSDADVPVIGKPLERRALDKVLSRFLPDAPQTRRRAQ
jgi:CheY-like chemotaxis protein